MIYELSHLAASIDRAHAEINGKWVPARPINYRCESWWNRVKAAWLVLCGKADAVIWPEGQ